MQAAPGDYQITWRLGAADHCALCVGRDGKTFTFHSLPGWPGDGGFGGADAICLGGANCACSLEYTQLGAPVEIGGNTQRPESVDYYSQQLSDITARRDAAEQARQDFLDTVPEPARSRAHTRDSIRRELADAANQRIRDTGGYPGVSVEPADIDAPTVAARTPAHMKAADAELEALARHVRKGRLISTWEPRNISQHALARIAELAARGVAADAAIDAVKAMRRVDLNGQEYVATDMTPYSTPPPAGGGGRVFPAHDADDTQRWLPALDNRNQPGGKTDDDLGHWQSPGGTPVHAGDPGVTAGRVAKGTADPVDAGHVENLMRGNFPPRALDWVRGARWVGPVQVPLDRVDWDDQDTWAASRQKERVREFAKRIEAGDDPHPVIGVQTPGSDRRVKLVDGHHRALAYKRLGRPVVAYLGFPPAGDDRWRETHSYQLHQGADPANKTTSVPVAAGVAVRAADTGRVLMLQRANTDDDPAAGMWEFPGGCLEPGESPGMAAIREWAEETGCRPPAGVLTGQWASSNGAYHGFVYTVPSEDAVPIHDGRDQVINPDDPDGDQTEALAWWGFDQLADNPAVRPELAADLDRVLAALAATP